MAIWNDVLVKTYNYLRDQSLLLGSLTEPLHSISEEYVLAVQRGQIPDQQIIWKFGFSDVNSTGSMNTVRCSTAGLYTYAIGYDASADTVDIASTDSVSDDGLNVFIEGLDADGNQQTVTTTIGSTTSETWSRVFRAYNSNGTEFVGDIMITDTTTSTNLAHIRATDQQTLQAMYTIPLGYTGYLFAGEISVGSGKQVEMDFSARGYGGVFRTVEKLIMFENSFSVNRPRNPIPALSDIEVRIKPDSTNTYATAVFGILLIKD